jgi:hypothetical protein
MLGLNELCDRRLASAAFRTLSTSLPLAGLPVVAQTRNVDCILQCPLSEVIQKTFAHTEFFSVSSNADVGPA